MDRRKVILIVGQAPSRTSGSERAFDGRSGARLAALAGTTLDEFLARVRTANLLAAWPGKAAKGDLFDARAAREAAARVELAETTLLAGRKVAAAFGVKAPYLEWVARGASRVAIFPHPSGVSRWWNDPANEERARRFLRDALS